MNEATMTKRTSKLFSVLVLSIFLLSMTVSAFGAVKKDPRYSQQNGKDFNTDAPWRVQNADTPIPFVFAIKDVHINDLNELWTCKIWITDAAQKNPVLIYSHDFNSLPINANTEGSVNGNWELNVAKFENPESPYSSLNGKEITATNLGVATGGAILFKTEIAGEDELGKNQKFSKYLKVVVGTPLPKPSTDWYYGDTHYHTEYTNNPYEYGGTLISTQKAIGAMGLDWVTTTDHASDYGDITYTDYDFDHWDLSEGAFANLKDRAKNLNGIDGLPFLVGEEVTVQARGEIYDDQLHLLVYNNDSFISGKINNNSGLMNPYYSLDSRLNLVKNSAFAFAAHPTYFENTGFGLDLLSDMAEWSNENYKTAIQHDSFKGLEVWNGRAVYTKEGIGDTEINPFNTNGTWETLNNKWDENLKNGIIKWDELLFNQLYDYLKLSKPLRKIFIEGGSDAHGDFNYFTSGVFSNISKADDNALGKVRTLVYAPEGYQDTNILNGLKNGHSVITDGPVCIFGIDKNGDGELTNADTIIGDDVVLTKGLQLKFLIKWKSTKEFGPVEDFVIYRGSAESATPKPITPIMTAMTGDKYSGSFTWEEKMDTVSNGMIYYYRMEVISCTLSEEYNDCALNPTKYRCLTNPIWVSWNTTTPDPNTAFQPVPDTGITKCYNDTEEIPCPKEGEEFYGQDGNYSVNPMSYTKLDSTGKDLPITATSWAMVRDNVTGLIWENNSRSNIWYYAPTLIASLNTAKFGGYSDWRLPTMTELGSIVDFSVQYPGPTINTNFFKNTSNIYWSSATGAHDIRSAWGVNFWYGYDSFYNKDYYYDGSYYTYSNYYVRAVRLGESVIRSFDPLVINGDRIVSDNTTGLMWQQDTAKTATGGTTMVWKDALSYCENLTLGGYTDWRLPTVKELRSIVDYTVYSPAIDTSVFKDMFASFYWSSSTNAHGISHAWGVGFHYGNASYGGKDGANYVRAVRAGQLVIPPVSNKPTVQTGAASAVTTNSATLNGTINPNGTSTTYYFQYGTTTSYGKVTPAGDAGSGTTIKSVSANITGLTANTLYHVQLVGKNTAGTVYGGDKTFTTTASSITKPVVTTGSASLITENSAKLSGTVTPKGASTTYYFEYGATTAYGKKTAILNAGSGTASVSVSANLVGFSAGTTYYFRLVATNSAGTAYGVNKTFTTTKLATVLKPTVTTEAATSITATLAKLNGTVNPNGDITSYYFQYGLTTSYGSTTRSPRSGSERASFSVYNTITGLTKNTTYHFRIVAINSAGTTYGLDKTFTTLP